MANFLPRLSGAGIPSFTRNARLMRALVVVWLLAIVTGLLVLTDYELRPAEASLPPEHWPSAAQLSASTDSATLLMFVHPRCPCSRASLAELDRLMEQRTVPVSAYVLFIQPEGTDEDWSHTALWRDAEQIPGVTVLLDESAAESRRFLAETSGMTLLYDVKGRLLFSGGITASRGHYGANAASDQLLALLSDAPTAQVQHATPVFGCPLNGPNADCCEVQP